MLTSRLVPPQGELIILDGGKNLRMNNRLFPGNNGIEKSLIEQRRMRKNRGFLTLNYFHLFLCKPGTYFI